MTSLSDVHRIVADSNNVPFQNMLLEMNPNCLALIVILGFTMALVIKVRIWQFRLIFYMKLILGRKWFVGSKISPKLLDQNFLRLFSQALYWLGIGFWFEKSVQYY